jgi:RsiW-degrading membrane proteinase PrsW (M82 family)
MDNKNFLRAIFPILLIFIISNGFILTADKLATKWDIDTDVVIIGNLVLFAATVISFFFYYKALRNNNVQAFLRMVYGGMFLRMMICLFTAFIYIMIVGKAVNKGAIITCLFFYLLYSFVEIALLMKQSKQRKNV